MAQYNCTNIVFRAPASLKRELTALAKEKEQHVSALIRTACLEFLQNDARLDEKKTLNHDHNK
jgi:hypothetical protein